MDNATSLKLIHMYASNQLLWDPRHKLHYNKEKREEAWDCIAESIGAPKHELIAKMRSLQGTYRREKNREKKLIGKNRPYQSRWYAYQAFSFMRDKDPLASEDSPDLQELRDNNCYVEVPGNCTEDLDEPTDDDFETHTEAKSAAKMKSGERKLPMHPRASKISNSSAPKPHKLVQNLTTKDPYVSFGLYIASELRKYDSLTLANVKHAINNVIYQADTDFYKRNNSVNDNRAIDKIKCDVEDEVDIEHETMY